jgi:hypothetical protein
MNRHVAFLVASLAVPLVMSAVALQIFREVRSLRSLLRILMQSSILLPLGRHARAC